MEKIFTQKKISVLLHQQLAIMDVPLESERHTKSPILAKSPTAQETAQDKETAQHKSEYWMLVDVQIKEANEKALAQFKLNQRILKEYLSTYDANYPSLWNSRSAREFV